MHARPPHPAHKPQDPPAHASLHMLNTMNMCANVCMHECIALDYIALNYIALNYVT